MRDYTALTREQVEARLNAAEDVCVMYGWSPSKRSSAMSERERATYALWRRWTNEFDGDSSPNHNRHLSDAVIADLASEPRLR